MTSVQPQPQYPPPQGAIAQQPMYGEAGGGAPGYGPPPGGPPPMQPPAAPPGCPPGLEYLLQVDQLIIKQDVEMFEAFTGYETNNKYKILNSMGQQVFLAAEDTCCCFRNCGGSSRLFTIDIMDNLGKKIMVLEAPCRCDSCFCPCCLRTVEVQAPPGTVIGRVEQSWSIIKPKYAIKTASGDTAVRIQGPCCPKWELCGDRTFQVYTADGETACGQITKQWSGLLKEVFTDADNFGVTFPVDMDVNVKATILAAVFLIDFMYFEESANQDD